jgi:hypothetical protein
VHGPDVTGGVFVECIFGKRLGEEQQFGGLCRLITFTFPSSSLKQFSEKRKGLTVFEDPSYINLSPPLLTCPPISRAQTMDDLGIALHFLFA